MGTTRLLCVVLLLTGTSNAFPQYPGQTQQTQVEQQPGPVQTQLTEQQVAGLENFWWQNQGVFDNPGEGGTVVVVQEQSPQAGVQGPPGSSFIPTPSPHCPPFEGCIPWKYCVDGVFKNTGEGLISVRVQPQIPEEFAQKLCGQIGNVCCRIPDELLAAQLPGQPTHVGPHGAGFDEIIEIISSGSPLNDQVQTSGAVGGIPTTGGVDPYVNDDGQITVVTGTGVDGTVQVADQTGVESVGGPSIANVGQTGGQGGYDTGSTGGLIEVVPGERETGCPPFTHDCVPHFQCIDGEINTSGAGLIDIRIPPPRECTNPEYPEIAGKCCRIPGATLPPTPAPVQICPGTTVCTSIELCNHDVTAGVGLLNPRNEISCYLEYLSEADFSIGVCCEPPKPAHLETCPGNHICVAKGTCTAKLSADYDPSSVLTCYENGNGPAIGECCPPPPEPVTPAPLAACPGTHECVESYQCTADGTINTDGAGLINVRVYHKPCYLNTETYTTGVCCQPPTPPTPAPLKKCPGNQVCVSQGNCASGIVASSGVSTGYDSCFLQDVAQGTGVCCDPPIPIVDVCPGDSVCIPEILCQGEILNAEDAYIPHSNTGIWTQCPLSGGLETPGVCCRNPAPVSTPTPSPYEASGQCGVRNPNLDLRSALQKNDAHFGEFPWQAIIFFTNYTFKCGASIIDNRWLLTGAHCVNGYKHSDFKVRVGEWQVDTYDEPLKYEDVNIISITTHPDFKPASLHNDVALIELETPLTFQYHINSVCLPNVNQIPEVGKRCFATGWGKDAFTGNYQAILKKIDVPYVDKTYCQDLLRKTRLGKYFVLDKSFMCAGGEENKDACSGDGGGPLVCEDPSTGRYYVAGITAWGIDCGVQDVPGVYVDVQLFRPWIDGIISISEQQQQGSSAYGR